MADFKGRTALITGGTSGIGRAAALELASRGANVVITGRRDSEGKAVASEAGKRGGRAVFVKGDVTDESHIKNAVETAAGITGTLDFAFNNAGLELMGVPTAEASDEQYRKVFDVNVLGVLLSMKHQIRAMTRAGRGSIVNNASVAGSRGMAGVGIYCASKHAVIGLTRSAALEVAKTGIRINTVSPAAIDTEMYDRFVGGPEESKTREYMAALHPVGRIGRPEEVALAAVYLLSDAASFITGHDLRVDGGFMI